MYNSQYYTCEQIDERLLQGYLDDYNTQTGQSLTKAQFLTKLGSIFSKEGVIDNTATQIGYYECDTAAGTAAKAITVANYALFAGGSMKVKFANKNTANNATLNINSQGAKALYYQGERASATNSWDAEEVVEIYYDGTSYYANNVKGGSGSGVYDVSKEHPTSGPNSDGKFTLEYILNSSNVNELIPVNKRYPGMTIQFVSTSDNKYVQYRCVADEFTTDVTQWQGVDDEPIPNSQNLIKSGGVLKILEQIYSDELYIRMLKPFIHISSNVAAVLSQYVGLIYADGSIDTSRTDCHYSNKFPIKPNTTYVVGGASFINVALYDINGDFVRRIPSGSNTVSTFTTAINEVYIVLVSNTSLQLASVLHMNEGIVLSDYEPFYCYLDKDAIDPYFDNISFKTGEKVKNTGIDENPTPESKNLVESGGVSKAIDEKTHYISNSVSIENEEEIIIEDNEGYTLTKMTNRGVEKGDADELRFEDNNGNEVASINPNGVQVKKLMDLDGNILISVPLYLSPDGSDENDGLSEDTPRLNIQNAINDGYRNLILAPGEYKNQQVSISNIDGLSIICNTSQTGQTIYDSRARRKHAIIDNSIDIEDLSAYNSIYRTALTVDSSHIFYKVFISHEKPIIYDGPNYWGATPTYWAILWEITSDVLTCKKLVPVLTVEECENTAGTFNYDGSYLYIHPYESSITGKTYKRLNVTDNTQIGVVINNSRNIYIQGVDICYFPLNNFKCSVLANTIVKDCIFSFTAYSSSNSVTNCDMEYHCCIAAHAGNDGWGISGNGNCSLYNCNGIHCYDDGVSHHNYSSGVIDGGQWIYNGKGGVTPSFGSDVVVKNIFAAHNKYGLYYYADNNDKTSKEIYSTNCVLVDNNTQDLKIEYYKIILSNSVYQTKLVFDNASTYLTEYNNKQLNN